LKRGETLKRNKRSFTQADVAKLAGVDRSVVSLIINGRDEGRESPHKEEDGVWRAAVLNYY